MIFLLSRLYEKGREDFPHIRGNGAMVVYAQGDGENDVDEGYGQGYSLRRLRERYGLG